jgi:hypothetical protein
LNVFLHTRSRAVESSIQALGFIRLFQVYPKDV